MRAGLLIVLTLLASWAPAPARAALAPAERRAMAAIDAGTPAAVALLERLVNQNSGTGNIAGVHAVADLLAPPLAARGFATRWVDGAAFHRAGHLVATRRGREAKLKVLFIGHLDTVFEADSPFQHYERLPDSLAHGPGVADMKGGDVEMLLVLDGLKAAGALEHFDLRIVLDGDEENAGTPHTLARTELLAAAQGCDVAIGFEDGAGEPAQALTARRGSAGWTLRVAGHPAHSSQIFRPTVGAGAVYETARILDQFRDSLAAEPHLTLNAGLIAGGSHVALEGLGHASAAGKANVVPESTLVTGDLRVLTPAQYTHACAVMTRIVARHLPGTDATITFDDGYPPLAPAPGHDAMLAAFDRASRELGMGPVTASNPDDAGAADISWVRGTVPMALDGVGLLGPGGHTVNERGDLRTLSGNARRVTLMLLRLAAESTH